MPCDIHGDSNQYPLITVLCVLAQLMIFVHTQHSCYILVQWKWCCFLSLYSIVPVSTQVHKWVTALCWEDNFLYAEDWRYAMKVMTSFGYEIMLPRGFWFQTLDVNKPWRQIPADRLFLFFGVHTFFFLITPRQYEEEKFRSNQTTLLKAILRLPIAE